MSEPTDVYDRLQALNESRVRGVDDPAMDRVLAKARAALIRELLRCISAIERLPVEKDRDLALEQAAKRASQIEYLRCVLAELGGAPQ